MATAAVQFRVGLPAIPSFSAQDFLTLLFGLLLLILLYVMTRNYLRLRAEQFQPDLQAGEQLLDRLTTDWGLSQSEHLLTDRRLLQFRKSWLFSWRRVHSLALEDATLVTLRRGMNVVLLLLAYLLSRLPPLALVLFMLGVERRLYSIRFRTHSFFPLRPRIGVYSGLRTQLGEFNRFYRRAQQAWAGRRIEKGLAAPTQVEAPQETDFTWGRAVWVAVGIYALAALLQRLGEPHVSLNDYVFAPVYLGLPVALARRGWHEAAWSAILGMAMVLAIAFPGVLPADFPAADIPQYVVLLVGLAGVALTARALVVWAHPALGPAALLLWPLLVALYDSRLLFDYGLYTRTALAMGVAVVAAWLSDAEGKEAAGARARPASLTGLSLGR